MLQQELRQRDEDIAAKSAEIGELKERVAELEKLKAEQQTLLTLKDSELAAAQQRLAEANKLAAQPAATKTAQAVPASPEPETAQQDQFLEQLEVPLADAASGRKDAGSASRPQRPRHLDR